MAKPSEQEIEQTEEAAANPPTEEEHQRFASLIGGSLQERAIYYRGFCKMSPAARERLMGKMEDLYQELPEVLANVRRLLNEREEDEGPQ